MNDTRMIWVTYFSPEPEKIAVILPKSIEADAIKTLINQCGNKGQPKIIQQDTSSSAFSPLAQTQLSKLDCNTTVYLLKSRESFKQIKRKLNADGKLSVIEYSIFPSWENPRWLVPAQRSLLPGKMSRMIQPSRLVAKLAVSIFRLLKIVNCTHYLFPCRLIVAHNNNTSFLNFFNALGTGVKTGIVYTGSFGPLQKFTVELLDENGTPFAYAKFGHNKLSKQAIQNEQRVLKSLKSVPLSKVIIPELITAQLPETIADRTLIIKKLDGGNPLNQITDVIVTGLAELFSTTQENHSTNIKDYICIQITSLQELDCSGLDQEFIDMRDEIVAILHNIANSRESTAILPLALSHGDFTRWNVRADDKNIYIIDWEEAAPRPLGHDLLTFLLAEYLLVTQTEPEQVVPRIIKEITSGILNNYIEKINLTNNTSTFDNTLLGILFFSEVVRSNLWHMTMHHHYEYPEKKSLSDLIKTSWACCVELEKGLIDSISVN
ncbi:MAG: aminoglycoside phosphotransferase family protein [Desulfobulbaceae bacterium]|nr:aminoglycoside phosphotransferase family protein [Desulfobulbaceae bacterium]